MTKRLVDIDDEVLEQARDLLATGTIKATVNTALREASAVVLRRRDFERAHSGGLPDLADPEVMASAWR